MLANLSKLSGWGIPAVTVVWGATLFGVLQIQHVSMDAGHSICGPWGCGPPLPPLMAYHSFWVVLLSLPTGLICRASSPTNLRKTGWILCWLGLAGLVLVGVWELIPALPHWLYRVPGLAPRYYLQRYLLSVVTLVDVPIVPIILAGVACLTTARVRCRQQRTEVTSSGEEQE